MPEENRRADGAIYGSFLHQKKSDRKNKLINFLKKMRIIEGICNIFYQTYKVMTFKSLK